MDLLTAAEAAAQVGRERSTIRYWVHRKWLAARATGHRGEQLFSLTDVFECEREARQRLQNARVIGRPRRVAAVPTRQESPNRCMVMLGEALSGRDRRSENPRSFSS